MKEVPLFDGKEGHGDLAFERYNLKVLAKFNWDKFCEGATTIAGSILSLAAVTSTLF